jgi:hypothetical protein
MLLALLLQAARRSKERPRLAELTRLAQRPRRAWLQRPTGGFG